MAKRKKRGEIGTVLNGTTLQGSEPDWGPLENVLAWHACNPFMWMFEVELENGTRLHAYKHSHNRRYLHLSASGEAWSYVWKADDDDFDPSAPSEYCREQLHRMIAAVLGPPSYPEVQAAEARRFTEAREVPSSPEIPFDDELDQAS